MNENCNHSHNEEEHCDCCCCCDEEKELVRDRRELSDEEIEKIISEKYADKTGRRAKDFLRKALRIHGDRYNYSQMEYKDCKTRITIICEKHGAFQQTPDSHINNKAGCSKCFNEATGERCRMKKEEFIKRASEKYNNKFKYDKVEYIDYYTDVEIICPVHGSFYQSPISHLYKSSYGCKECMKEAMHDLFAKTTEQFIKDARKVHGDKYRYDKVDYINNETKVTIWCPKHGYFEQLPAGHLYGFGCPKCGDDTVKEKLTKTTEQFIEDAKKIHGDKYGYDKTIYTGVFDKVTIWCPEHGYFEQLAHDHLRGRGCPSCAASNGEIFVETFLKSLDILFEARKYTIINDNNYVYPDFILTDVNIWIEYNGEQHYEYVDYYHNHEKTTSGSRSFLDQLVRDKNVRIYCKENGIKLIEIPYIFNTYEKVSEFLNKVLFQDINPDDLFDISSLYNLDNTGFKIEDLFPT